MDDCGIGNKKERVNFTPSQSKNVSTRTAQKNDSEAIVVEVTQML